MLLTLGSIACHITAIEPSSVSRSDSDQNCQASNYHLLVGEASIVIHILTSV